MNKLAFTVSSIFVLLTAISFQATSHAEPANLGLLTQEIKQYHESGAYEKEVAEVAKKAENFIENRVRENLNSPHPRKLAIVLDIDETSLTNYHYMLARHFLANKQQLHQEILNADAPALKPILHLYRQAIHQGVSVFFVTGRYEVEREATLTNLKAEGYVKFKELYLKPNDYENSSIVPFKAKIRKEIEQQGYTIIANLGDQDSDLKGGFAEKSFKLPNPYYYLP